MGRNFCLAAWIAIGGLGACTDAENNQAGNGLQAANCADAGRDERDSVMGVRPGMRESQARAILECRFPGMGRDLSVDASGERPRQNFEFLTLKLAGPDATIWGIIRRIEYTQQSTIPSPVSKAAIQRRYGPFEPINVIHPAEYKEVGLYYSRLNQAPDSVPRTGTAPCLSGIDRDNMARVQVASSLYFADSPSGPVRLAECGTMMFVSRGDYEGELTGFVDFIMIDFSLLARLAHDRDERERRARQSRAEQQRRNAEKRVENGTGLDF